VNFFKRVIPLNDQIESILETRRITNEILAQHTGKSMEEIDEATAYDNYMNAEQAIAFGLCDKIVDTLSFD